MPPIERHPLLKRVVLNHKIDPEDKRDLKFSSTAAPGTFPPKVDLTPEMPEVYDQKEWGTCTCNSNAANVEYRAIKHAKTIKKINLFKTLPSRLYLYSLVRQLEGVTDLTQDTGATNRGVMKTIAKYSVPDETLWKYSKENFAVLPPERVQVQAHGFKNFQYLAVSQTLNDTRACLAQGFAFCVGLQVYESFMSVKTMERDSFSRSRKRERTRRAQCAHRGVRRFDQNVYIAQ
jgi:hypothetical protein